MPECARIPVEAHRTEFGRYCNACKREDISSKCRHQSCTHAKNTLPSTLFKQMSSRRVGRSVSIPSSPITIEDSPTPPPASPLPSLSILDKDGDDGEDGLDPQGEHHPEIFCKICFSVCVDAETTDCGCLPCGTYSFPAHHKRSGFSYDKQDMSFTDVVSI